MQQEYYCNDIYGLDEIAVKLLEKHKAGRIFCFYGAMGAGKTTFIKTICKEMGVKDIVNSPTFAIINEYYTPLRESVYHFDLYRIEEDKELVDIGFEEYLYSGAYCFIEWPENAKSFLPENYIMVTIGDGKDDNSRIIRF